jgi:hypothetical protein
MLLLLSIAAAAPPAWVEFDRRPSGWADSPYEYDAASVRRDGARVRATYRYRIFLSGLPDPHYRVGVEIDCARHQARVYEARVTDGLGRRGWRPRRMPAPAIAATIAPDSIEESLARRLCEGR